MHVYILNNLQLTCCRSKSAMGITSAETKMEHRRTPSNWRKAIVMVVLVRIPQEALQLMCWRCVAAMFAGSCFMHPRKPAPQLPDSLCPALPSVCLLSLCCPTLVWSFQSCKLQLLHNRHMWTIHRLWLQGMNGV